MEDWLARQRGERLIRELARYPAGLFTLDELLFFSSHCRRLAGAPVAVTGTFNQESLAELERIAERVKAVRSSHMTLLEFKRGKRE